MASKTQLHKQLFTEEEKNSIPFVRVLNKKIRNISKKLTEIKQLEQKNLSSLKHQQKEKLSKKESLLVETMKYENALQVYKEVMKGQQKDQSQTEKIINLLIIGRYLHKAKVVDKILSNIEQIQVLKSIYDQIINDKHHLNNKQKLLNLQSHFKTYLKNDHANTVVQKIIKNKQFLNASLPLENTFEQTKIQEIKKIFDVAITENSKKLEQAIVNVQQNNKTHQKNITMTQVKVEGNHIKIDIQKISSNRPNQQTAKTKQAKTPQTNPQSENQNSNKQNSSPQNQINIKQKSGNKSEKKRYNKYGNYKGIIHQNKPNHRKSEQIIVGQDNNRFTKEQKSQLVNDGFTIIEPKKQATKTNYKRFVPNRDNRQYYQ